MAKRYKVKWTPVVEIKECRGQKRTENPMHIRHKENYIENILLDSYLTILADEVGAKETLKEWWVSLFEEVCSIRQLGPKQEGDTIYCDPHTIDTNDVRRLLSWYHRKEGSGSFHLSDEERLVVRKGQLVVPADYQCIPLVQARNPSVWVRYQAWKKKLLFLFSEREADEVMCLLVAQAISKRFTESKWVREAYGDRVDYLPTLQTNEIETFFLWHILQEE